MSQPAEYERQWKAIAAWDWERIERAVAEEGVAHLHPVQGQRPGPGRPAEAAPEDQQSGTPAELAPEDLRREVKQDVQRDLQAPLSPEGVERELYYAAALHAHCQQHGLAMGAGWGPDGAVWICVRRPDGT